MELSHQSEFDETSVEPDGRILVSYHNPQTPDQNYWFSDMKRWYWCEEHNVLVVIYKNGNRVEIPRDAIRWVTVTSNSDRYTTWAGMKAAEEHVDEVSKHLQHAQKDFEKKVATWRATS